MKHFSAQYVYTNTGPALKRAVITTEDDGTVSSVEDTGGKLKETDNVEFHNGIIIPGFVNCHCHLELSHMKGSVTRGSGLSGFLKQVVNTRENNIENIVASARSADIDMYNEGVDLCADICNTSLSFGTKKESRIHYINLLEVFGSDPEKALFRMAELTKVAETAAEKKLPFNLVPHAVYSMSLALLSLLKEKSSNNQVTSIHFMETEAERDYLENHSGPLLSLYTMSGLAPEQLKTPKNHTDIILNKLTQSGNLILVHNTFTDRETIRSVKERGRLFWCLCPGSNLYIENKIPPLDLLIEEGCEIVIGTDSLASNNKLSIFEEIKILQSNFPSVSIENLVKWATINGAKALGEENSFGKIEPGKKPGLLLLQNVDLVNMKLLPESTVKRLI